MKPSRLALLALVALSACQADGPVGPPQPPTSLQVAGGDGQLAAPGSTLPLPLRVSVRRLSDDGPASGITVSWSLLEGSGARLGSAATVTGSEGIAQNTLVLGPLPGAYTIRASTEQGAALDFHAWGVEPPRLEALEPSTAQAGGRVRLKGRSFRTELTQNLVLFDGFRGRVLASSDSLLDVEVPPCLPSRPVSVTVTVGSAASQGLPLLLTPGSAQAPGLEVGQSRRVDVVDGMECLRLDASGAYLLVAQSAATVGGGLYAFSLRGVSARTQQASAPPITGHDADPPPHHLSYVDVFHQRLRVLEDASLTASPSASIAAPARVPVAGVPPKAGDQASFHVVDGTGRFQDVQSVARLVSARVALYVDVEVTAGALSELDLSELAADFDDPVFPVVSDVFGTPSDLDGNQRVIVLITAAVNRLTPRGSPSFVGGFFFGPDLLPEISSSNGAEVLYVMAPDPEGRFGDPRSRDQVMSALPSTLAHEFMHMVHFNERMLVRRASRNEALWLSEALAQSAETLVGDTFQRRGASTKAARYLQPMYQRVRVYLEDPGPVSLLVSEGLGTLGERGAGWLFLRYLQAHHPGGGPDLLRTLTQTARTGLENVEAASGRPWPDSFSDWSVATFTDGLPQVPSGPLHYPDFDLRAVLSAGSSSYPLIPRPLADEFDQQGSRLAASSAYFVLENSRPVAVRLADRFGGPPVPGARFVLRVVRLR